jgi:hypothetical protein
MGITIALGRHDLSLRANVVFPEPGMPQTPIILAFLCLINYASSVILSLCIKIDIIR